VIKSVSSIEIYTEIIWAVNKTNNPGCQGIGLQFARFRDRSEAKKTADNFLKDGKVGVLHKRHNLFTGCRRTFSGLADIIGKRNKFRVPMEDSGRLGEVLI